MDNNLNNSRDMSKNTKNQINDNLRSDDSISDNIGATFLSNNHNKRAGQTLSEDTTQSLPEQSLQGMFNMFINLDQCKKIKSVPTKFSRTDRKQNVSRNNLSSVTSSNDVLVKLSDLDRSSTANFDNFHLMKENFFPAWNLSALCLESNSLEQMTNSNQLMSIPRMDEIHLKLDFEMTFSNESDVLLKLSDGVKVKAHKNILQWRSPFFLRLFRGSDDQRVYELKEYSWKATMYALNYIYHGRSDELLRNRHIIEIAKVANLYQLEGLKDMIMENIITNKLHNFHSPCPKCLAVVNYWLEDSLDLGLEDLYYKCLDYITLHYELSWTQESFSTLPENLLNTCLWSKVYSLKTSQIIDIHLASFDMLEDLKEMTDRGPTIKAVNTLITKCVPFISCNLNGVIVMDNLKKLSSLREVSEERYTRIRDNILLAIEITLPITVFQSYVYLTTLDLDENDVSSCKELITSIKIACESVIVMNMRIIVSNKAWSDLHLDVRIQLQNLVHYVKHHPLSHDQKRNVSKTMMIKLQSSHIRNTLANYHSRVEETRVVPVINRLGVPSGTVSEYSPNTKIPRLVPIVKIVPPQYKHVESRYMNIKPVRRSNSSVASVEDTKMRRSFVKSGPSNETAKLASRRSLPSRIPTLITSTPCSVSSRSFSNRSTDLRKSHIAQKTQSTDDPNIDVKKSTSSRLSSRVRQPFVRSFPSTSSGSRSSLSGKDKVQNKK